LFNGWKGRILHDWKWVELIKMHQPPHSNTSTYIFIFKGWKHCAPSS
jgi:hypothetical protein